MPALQSLSGVHNHRPARMTTSGFIGMFYYRYTEKRKDRRTPKELKDPSWPSLSNEVEPTQERTGRWILPRYKGYKYLSVMIDTFTGWIEGFPTRTEKAEEVVKNYTMKSF